MPRETAIIDIRHLSKSFGDKQVLKDINFYINRGEFITFLGPSGCGKTTLLRMIGGFLNPDEGEIVMDGKNMLDIPPYKRPLNTVFQRYALFPHLDVYDNIAFGLKLNKLPEDEIDAKVRKVLKMVSMSGYEDRDIDSLSGGQQQRVAIARALVNEPKVLLLDEPLSALDAKMRKDMQQELKEMHRKLGITFIFVTHDQEEALALSDTIVVFNDGVIQQIGTPTDIYNEPVNEFVADFIGESNILDGTMIEDRKVSFLGHEFECVDSGFAPNEPVDVVLRPEDLYVMSNLSKAQFTAKVLSCTFKGVFYDIMVSVDGGYELLIQDYSHFEPGSEVGVIIKPQDIQVMHKLCTTNETEAKVIDSNHLEIFGECFECLPLDAKYSTGDQVRVAIDFDKMELQDNQEDGTLCGEVYFIIYKGNHYHLTVRLDSMEHILVDTDDIWDKGDLVGISIKKENIRIIA